MFRLDQHIELLLLRHNCVIVPDFGGFVVHHINAHFDERDGMMLPPKDVVGFNKSLNINDSLLVQSYIDTYDISYPEAQRQIEAEVVELNNMIEEYGFYDIRSLGRLSLNKHGDMEFEPTESGILAPRLYGLPGVNTKEKSTFLAKDEILPQPSTYLVSNDNADSFIKISTSTLRNVVAACIAAVLMLCIPLLKNSENTKLALSNFDLNVFSKLDINDVIKKEITPKKTFHIYVNKTAKQVQDDKPEVKSQNPTEKIIATDTQAKSFVIVLAARVSQKNADAYVADLTQRGLENVRVIGEGKGRKVVYGSFENEDQAQKRRRELSGQDEFSNAWVTQI